MRNMDELSYDQVLSAAMDDLTERGYQSAEQIAYWSDQLRRAAERSMKSMGDIERMVREAMTNVWRKQVENEGVLKTNPGVSRYTVEKLKPELRKELDKRIQASLDLIKVNRPQAVEKTVQRFQGWATSIPTGGSDVVKRADEKAKLKKALASQPFEVRRCVVDQSAKLVSAINNVVAVNGGAIGARWRSHAGQLHYNSRPDHAAREGRFFLIRGSWADKAGYVKLAGYKYTDQLEQPAELPFCRCAYEYVYSLRDIPEECMTVKGKQALEEARAKIAAMR